MKPHVIFEFLFLAEDNIADRAGLPLLSGVSPLVRVTSPLSNFNIICYTVYRDSPLLYLVTECHFAEVTLVGLYSEMDTDVPKDKNIIFKMKKYFLSPFKVAFLDKLFRTVRTFVSGAYVDQEMLVKTVSPAELFAAVFTLVDLAIFMAKSVVV